MAKKNSFYVFDKQGLCFEIKAITRIEALEKTLPLLGYTLEDEPNE